MWTKKKPEFGYEPDYALAKQKTTNKNHDTEIKIAPKSLAVYRKREREFQQQFQFQLDQWEQERVDEDSSDNSSDDFH